MLVVGACAGMLTAHGEIPFSQVYNEVRIDQNLGAQIPLGLSFRDEQGKSVRLEDLFRSRPVILSLVYYQCPMLCTQVLNGMVAGFQGLGFTAGNEFTVVTVSIDPHETPVMALQKKEHYLQQYRRPAAAAGWHFLTGDESSIHALASAVGFHYLYDTTTGQFAHASGIMVATPEGKLSHYFFGIEYSPKDLRLALVDASHERIGSIADRLLLLCYHYDPMTGKYGVVIEDIFRGAGALTVLLIAGWVLLMLRRERRKTTVTSQT
jgi:protein SCO1/2